MVRRMMDRVMGLVVILSLLGLMGAGEATKDVVALEAEGAGKVIHAGEVIKARVVVRNLAGERRKLRVGVEVLEKGKVLRSEAREVELAAGEERSWNVEYELEAGVYGGRVVARDGASDRVLGERRVEYRVFPRKREVAKGVEVIRSGLSPFVLVHNEGSRTRLFQEIEGHGLGGPAWVAYVENHQVKVVSTKEAIDPSQMTESWMLFWYGPVKGGDKAGKMPYAMDVPTLVVLQKMPAEIKGGEAGVEFVFPGESGYIAMVPFYGASVVRAARTAEWVKAFPQEVFLRCRLLAEVSREYPIKVEEQFRVQPGQDRVLVRDRFEFLTIDDDWATGHKKVAILEPGVALAQRYGFRHLTVAGKVLDLEMPVGAGLLAGIEGEECSYTLSGLLRYVNQVEQGKAKVEEGIRAAAEAALEPRGLTFEYDEKGGRMLVFAGGKEGEILRQLEAVAAGGDKALVAEYWEVIRGLYDGMRKGQSWGDGGSVGEAVSAARLAYWAGDEETYKLASYQAAKGLMGLWTTGMAYPKWVKEKDVWAGIVSVPGLRVVEENGQVVIEDARDEKKGTRRVEVEDLAFSKWGGDVGWVPGRAWGWEGAGDAERRFIKERMAEYAKRFGDGSGKRETLKYGAMWQGAGTPKGDQVYREGVGGMTNDQARMTKE